MSYVSITGQKGKRIILAMNCRISNREHIYGPELINSMNEKKEYLHVTNYIFYKLMVYVSTVKFRAKRKNASIVTN
jgi:hypothetical protein